MSYLRENFAHASLAVNVGLLSAQITVTSGHNLPTTAGQFILVVWDISTYPNPADDPGTEIMIASYSGTPNLYNVIRGQENTSISLHLSGSEVAMHLTAGLSGDDLNWLGTYQVDETGIAANKIIKFDGSKLAYTDSPSFVNVDLSGRLDIAEIPSPTAPAADKLRVYAVDDSGYSVLEHMDSTGLVFRINQDRYRIARNTSGVSHTKGQVVHFSGSTGNKPIVTLARANSNTTMPAVGVAVATVLDGQFGIYLIVGRLSGIDTSAFSEGDVIYVSSTVAGGMTNVSPVHPNFSQAIGTVEVSGVGSGAILVNIGPHLKGEESGTRLNGFTIGDQTAGAKTLKFDNGFIGNLSWNPTAARTITMPDASGEIALISCELVSRIINFDNSMTAAQIQALIDGVGKYIGPGVVITFQFADGTYTLDSGLTFQGFFGPGSIAIFGNRTETDHDALHTSQSVYIDISSVNGAAIYVLQCMCFVAVYNFKAKVKSDSGMTDSGIYVQQCFFVTVRYSYVLGTSTTNGCGIFFNDTAIGNAQQNYVSNVKYGIALSEGTLFSRGNDDTGTPPAYGLYARYAGTIGKYDATQPAGSTANELAQYGGVIR